MKKARSVFSTVSRFLFVLFILISAFLFTMFQGGEVSWTIFYILLPFILYSVVLFFYPLSSITAERVIRTPAVQNGGKLIVSLSVNRKFRFPLLYTVVTEKFTDRQLDILAGGKQKRFLVFGFRNKVQWEYEIERMPRGEHVLEGVQIEVTDFFGWIRKSHFVQIKSSILVYPKIWDVHYNPIDTQYDRGTTISPFNIVKDTSMATGIRDYQSGDRVAWIHWKSFARTQTLMTKEFEDRRSQQLILVLDGRPSNSFEEQVELAASILKEASSHQDGIGFVTTGLEHSVFPSIQSEVHLQQALIHLAKIKPTGSSSTVMKTNIGSALQQSTSMILITGSPDWPFLESVVQHSKSVRSVICFTVTKADGEKRMTFDNEIRIARSRGIKVRIITQSQFPEAFKEVNFI